MKLNEYYNQQARLQKAGLVNYNFNLFEHEYDNELKDITVEDLLSAEHNEDDPNNVWHILWNLDTPCREVFRRLLY